jgi:GT2 family glycosyltransferase
MSSSDPSTVHGEEVERATWLAPERLLVLLAAETVPPGKPRWRVLGAFELSGLDDEAFADALCSPAEYALASREQLDSAGRARLGAFLAATPRAENLLPLGPELAARLVAMRDILRDPLARTELAPGRPVVRLEDVTALDEYGFWLTGFVHAQAPRQVRMTAVSPEGARRLVPPAAVVFGPGASRSQQLEDDETLPTLGFHAYVELEDPSLHPTGWILEFQTADGGAVEDAAPLPVRTEGAGVRELVLEQIRGATVGEDMFAELVLPALARLREDSDDARIEKAFTCGSVASSPAVSVVIAVRRVDRIEHQLAQFARDPEISSAEIIFVAPRIGEEEELAVFAEELHRLYGSPFRVVQLSRPTRRVRALNLGASVARGRYLVLLSGDVLPRAPGWMEAMRAFYDSSPAIAAVGPKLLHEDDSIAHAGAEYVRRGVPARWLRTLELAGMPRTLHAASFPRPVAAVPDSCLMVAAERFGACDGFSELYLGPGDEAGDLCMRLAEAPGEIWYFPGAELYNLDRPDSPPNHSPAAVRFNDWLFSKRWGPRLAWTVADEPSESSEV